MKKLLYFLSLFLLVGLSANVFAAGTAAAPEPGETYTYSVTQNTGNDYLWWVSKSTVGGTAISSETNAFSLSETSGEPSYVNVSTAVTNLNSIDITWQYGAVGSTYFIHVEETDGTTGCTNESVYEVAPTTTFDVTIADVSSLTDANKDSDGTPDNGEVCYTDDVTITFNDPGFTYNHGTGTVYFRLTASNVPSSDTWNFNYTISLDDNVDSIASITFYTESGWNNGSSPTALSTVTPASGTGTGTNSTPYDGSAVTVTAGQTTVVVAVQIENMSANNAAATGSDITVTMALDTVQIEATLNEVNTGNNEADAVLSRPATTAISGS